MSYFIIRPHGRLQDWVAHEKGYFRAEGLKYRIESDEKTDNRSKDIDATTGELRDIRSGAFEWYEQGQGNKGEIPSDISCACHWTVNEAAARSVGRMWGNAYSVIPAAIMVRADSSARRPEDLAGRDIAVGFRSGSHYTTVQALEPFLKSADIKLKFGGVPWQRVDAGLDGDVPAVCVWGPALYVCEQLGMRSIIDTTFMGGFMFPPLTPVEDVERYFRALKPAQTDVDLAPEKYKHHYVNEIAPRYRDRVDVRRFGPGERVVFLPYSREVFDSTQRWIHERGLFETVARHSYESAVVR
jgi:NitT/TauT family transport system substrate-binding protein